MHGKVWGRPTEEHHMQSSIQHHSAPVVHHYISVEHAGKMGPMSHISTPISLGPDIRRPVTAAPVHPKVFNISAAKDKVRAAVGKVRSVGHRSTTALKNPKATKVAEGYKRIDEAQKAITTRPLL